MLLSYRVHGKCRRTRPLVFAATLLVFLAAASRPATVSAATLSATPNPAAAGGAEYSVSGCGFAVGTGVIINTYAVSALYFFTVPVDANGCISFTDWTGQPGVYTLQAWQQLRRKKQTMMASTDLTVE